MALSKLRLCDLFWVAWTEFGSVGVGRRTILRQIDKFSQIRATPGWTRPATRPAPAARRAERPSRAAACARGRRRPDRGAPLGSGQRAAAAQAGAAARIVTLPALEQLAGGRLGVIFK
jgi:hypothetical protein